jgi:hypothetical protein
VQAPPGAASLEVENPRKALDGSNENERTMGFTGAGGTAFWFVDQVVNNSRRA